jgi:DNA polymerase III alpha subunit
MDANDAQLIWDQIQDFSKYAFNKSHSVAYGIILFWTLYAKWKYPEEFTLGSIRSLMKEGHKDKIGSFIREAPRLGLKVYRPELNKSKAEATAEAGGIRYGYADVKGIGLSVAKWLEKNQPFADFDALLEYSQQDENKITLKNGIRKVAINKGQIESLKQLSELQDNDLLELEEKLLGVALSDDSAIVLDQYADHIADQCSTFNAVLNRTDQQYFTVAGIITEVRETKTKNGAPMAWVTLADAEGQELQMTVWQETLDRLRFALKRRTAIIANIVGNDRGLNLKNAKILFRKHNG